MELFKKVGVQRVMSIKRTMVPGLILLLTPILWGATSTLDEADKLFAKGQYQAALPIYESLVKKAQDDERFKALYRSCEADALLFRYGEALQRLQQSGVLVSTGALAAPTPLWKARFLLLEADLLRGFVRQYGGQIESDIVEGTTDAFRRSPQEMHLRIRDDYGAVLSLADRLRKEPLKNEAYFILTAGADFGRYPTLFDFAVLQASDYWLQETPEYKELHIGPSAMQFLKGTFESGHRDYRLDRDPFEVAAYWIDQAGQGTEPVRSEAREYWKIRRALLPFQYRDNKRFTEDQVLENKMAQTLLRGWMETFKYATTRAEAGYAAAELLNARVMFADSVALCKEVERRFKSTAGAKKCAHLRATIEMPSLDLSQVAVSTTGAPTLSLHTRNLNQVYARLYPVTIDFLHSHRGYARDERPSFDLRYLDPGLLKYVLTGSEKKPLREWVTTISTQPYAYGDMMLEWPKEGEGLYVLVVSGDKRFSPGESLLQGAIVNVSRLVLLGAPGWDKKPSDLLWRPDGPKTRTASGFHFYAIDALTGVPAVGATIDAYLDDIQNGGKPKFVTLKIDAAGKASLPAMTLDVSPGVSRSWEVDPLARWGKSVASWPYGTFFNFVAPAPDRVSLSTDRSIYRPGQQVQLKVTVLSRVPQGFTVKGDHSEVVITASDPNGQMFFTGSVYLNDLGSGTTAFTLPTGRLLGRYGIHAGVKSPNFQALGYADFSVEEYKRPEFEVSLAEAKGAWRFDHPVTVEGDVHYYFGGPVPQAAVTYKVYREAWWPDFFWWCGWLRSSYGGSQEVLQGQTRADASGRFSFQITPQAASQDPQFMTARFRVHIDARDAGGRTLTAEKTYVAGRSPWAFQIDAPPGFFNAKAPVNLKVRLVTLDGTGVSGDAAYDVFKFDKGPEALNDSFTGQLPTSRTLDDMFVHVDTGPVVQSGKLRLIKDKTQNLQLDGLSPGVYRVALRVTDPWGTVVRQSFTLLTVDPKHPSVSPGVPSITLAEHSEYAVGETARLFIGSSDLKGNLFVEVWSGSSILERKTLATGAWHLLEVPITADHRGGIVVRWFGMDHYQMRGGQVGLAVPWQEKRLSLDSPRFDTALKPGQRASWTFSVKDASGRPVEGEALIKMFDRSLEYYATSNDSQFGGLYPSMTYAPEGRQSQFLASSTYFPVDKGWIKALQNIFYQVSDDSPEPILRPRSTQIYKYKYGRRAASLNNQASVREDAGILGRAMATAPGGSMSLTSSEGSPAELDQIQEKGKSGLPASPSPGRNRAEAPVAVRSNFAETAFFMPQVPVTRGEAAISFTVPEQLTSWKVVAEVHTRDVKTGGLTRETATRKDLMVRLELPRFLREGDRGTFKAVIHNETESALKGSLTFEIKGPHAPELLMDARGGDAVDRVRDFSAPAHGVATVAFESKAPRGVAFYTVRAIARSGELVDAEERGLPLLPSRQRLVESTVVPLNGTVQKTLSLPTFEQRDPTREHESMHLQIDPQLALVVLNSLPYLVQYPYECVEQTLNRFVPLAITHEIYKKYPAMAAAAAKIPKRNTITPAWDRNDPRRLMTLMETPWLEESEGIRSSLPVIDLLDAQVVKHQKTDALEKLKAAQNGDGGFPWFPGGRSDAYMTLVVLDGLAEAKRYGVGIPEELASRALAYVNNEIPRHLKPQEADLSMVLYAAYVVTSFPDQSPGARQGYGFARAWLHYAAQHANAMTPIGKAYAAHAYWRLGEKAKGDDYLNRALDGAREDAVTGVYWTPEKYSWLWYSDSVEKHAFFLRTLQTLRPKDKRIPGMVQWLIFNRKGNVWKSTKASAAAVYALLDVMKSRGALDRGDDYKIQWGTVQEHATVGPSDWLANPLRWSLSGKEIGSNQGKAQITKKGPGLAFASLTWIYSTDELPKQGQGGLMTVERRYYRRVKEGDNYHLKLLHSMDRINVGDSMEVQLTVRTRSQFEYVHLQDPRGAGFESEELTSGWKWDNLSRYEEPRDSLTNFFVSWLPHGEYVLRYRLRPTMAGTYRIGAATLQSMYAPEMTAHSDGMILQVDE